MLPKALCLVCVYTTPCLIVSAQNPAAATLHYDVVSIKPNKADSQSMYWRTTPDGFSASNLTILMLLTGAYNTREGLVTGLPDWAQKAHFDINAKVLDADPDALKKLTDAQRDSMMAELLADRFHLKVHAETKQLPVYDLVVETGGTKLKPNPAIYEKNPAVPYKEGMTPGGVFTSTGEFAGVAVSLSTLTRYLEGELNRNIIDRTGLSSNYDIHLKWTPDRAALAGLDSGQPDAAPPLFTAMQQQLGLKLIPARGPVQIWIVDHIEHPTEN